MKRMLINGTQPEELRLAIVDGQTLQDYETEVLGREQRKGNIYKAIVTGIKSSIEACFVDYGEKNPGFLPFKEIARQYFPEGVYPGQANIKDVLKVGQELLVQVEKEELGTKGAALTTFISLAGRYVVLMPNNPRGGGVSRRIEGDDRVELKEALEQLVHPRGMSIIARTAGIGRSPQELQWDLDCLLKLWAAIEEVDKSQKGPLLIHQESNLVARALRDYFGPDVGEILIDTDHIYQEARNHMSHLMAEHQDKVKRYNDDVPLFSRFQIEHQIESAYARSVSLPSGGAIVIDRTEALVAIDVNSARSNKGDNIEETATQTNLEAADEVARQMRLRDLGGLIVIDFIDMEDSRNRREVENRLREALRPDRARVQVGSISKFGLLELSRQRLRPSLSEGVSMPCPRCGGVGHIRNTDASALHLLRIIQEEAMKPGTAALRVQVPVEVASFLLNEKRSEIAKIELTQRVHVMLLPNKWLEVPNYELERLKSDDARLDSTEASYKLIKEVEQPTVSFTRTGAEASNRQQPVLQGVLHSEQQGNLVAAATQSSSAAVQSSGLAGTALGVAAKVWAWLVGRKETADVQSSSANTASVGQTVGTAKGKGQRPSRQNAGGSGQQQRTADQSRRNERGSENTPQPSSRQSRGRQAQERSQTGDSNGVHQQVARRSQASQSQRSSRRDKTRAGRAEPGISKEQAVQSAEAGQLARASDVPAKTQLPPVQQSPQPELKVVAGAVAPEQNVVQPAVVSTPDSSAMTANQVAQDSTSIGAEVSQAVDGGERRERRSRDRYGRDRRRGAVLEGVQRAAATTETVEAVGDGRAEDAVQQNAVTVADVQAAAGAQAKEPSVVARSYFAADASAPVSALTVSERNNAVAYSDTPEPAMPPTDDMNMQEQVSTHPAPALAQLEGVVQQEQDLQALVQAAGLEWIQSDPHKVAAVQAQIAALPQPVHIPRERMPIPVIEHEPLILVETRVDLRNMVLPFEAQVSKQA